MKYVFIPISADKIKEGKNSKEIAQDDVTCTTIDFWGRN
jgi:hypothetical protein